MLSCLDFCQNYCVYVLSFIKIHHVLAGYKLHVEACVIWIGRLQGEVLLRA